MGFGPTPAQINVFASQTFIQKALKSPMQIASVLSFFFNVDYHDPSHVQDMKSGASMVAMTGFWYAGGPEYDALCRDNFSNAIRAAGKGELAAKDAAWQTTMDGRVAQILLCDQMTRNAFRGTDEAFAYDDMAMTLAREISQELVSSCSTPEDKSAHGITIPSLRGEVYPPYLQFLVSPLMHSETADDHALALEVTDYSLDVAPDNLIGSFENTRQMELEHKEVIDRFGRYPHRNKKQGRESTPEELEWLAKVDELPVWAKSQG